MAFLKSDCIDPTPFTRIERKRIRSQQSYNSVVLDRQRNHDFLMI